MSREKIRTADPPGPTIFQIKTRMADAITMVLTSNSKGYYDELSDDELFGFATVLWDYHTDLRDEFSRREMMKAAYHWAASMERP